MLYHAARPVHFGEFIKYCKCKTQLLWDYPGKKKFSRAILLINIGHVMQYRKEADHFIILLLDGYLKCDVPEFHKFFEPANKPEKKKFKKIYVTLSENIIDRSALNNWISFSNWFNPVIGLSYLKIIFHPNKDINTTGQKSNKIKPFACS